MNNSIAGLLSALQCVGKEWEIIGNQILCDKTPIMDLPDDSNDPAMKMRNDLMREVLRVVSDYSYTAKLTPRTFGPWYIKDSYIMLGSNALALLCDPEDERVPFQHMAIRLFMDIANEITPKSFNYHHVVLPYATEDGYSYEEAVACKRVVAVTPELVIVNIEMAQAGDTIYEAVYSNLYDHMVIKSYVFNGDMADSKPMLIDRMQYEQLCVNMPDLVDLLRFKDKTDLPILVGTSLIY